MNESCTKEEIVSSTKTLIPAFIFAIISAIAFCVLPFLPLTNAGNLPQMLIKLFYSFMEIFKSIGIGSIVDHIFLIIRFGDFLIFLVFAIRAIFYSADFFLTIKKKKHLSVYVISTLWLSLLKMPVGIVLFKLWSGTIGVSLSSFIYKDINTWLLLGKQLAYSCMYTEYLPYYIAISIAGIGVMMFSTWVTPILRMNSRKTIYCILRLCVMAVVIYILLKTPIAEMKLSGVTQKWYIQEMHRAFNEIGMLTGMLDLSKNGGLNTLFYLLFFIWIWTRVLIIISRTAFIICNYIKKLALGAIENLLPCEIDMPQGYLDILKKPSEYFIEKCRRTFFLVIINGILFAISLFGRMRGAEVPHLTIMGIGSIVIFVLGWFLEFSEIRYQKAIIKENRKQKQ